MLTVRSVHFDDLDTGRAQEPGEAGAVGAGPFDTSTFGVAELTRPAQQLGETRRCGRNLEGALHPAEGVDDNRDMNLGVSVDTEDDGVLKL